MLVRAYDWMQTWQTQSVCRGLSGAVVFMPLPPDCVGLGIVFGLSVSHVRSFVCPFVPFGQTYLVATISHEWLD